MNVKSFVILFFIALIFGGILSSILIVLDPFGEKKQVSSAITFPTPTVSKFNSENSNQSKISDTEKPQEEKANGTPTTVPLSEKELEEIRQKFRSGTQLTPDEMAKLRQQFQGSGGSGGRGGSSGGSGGGFGGSSVEGEISEIKGDLITVKSANVSTNISITEDTTIRFSSLMELKDLKIDLNVQVVAERSQDGQTVASFIRILQQNSSNSGRGGIGGNSSQSSNFLSGKITSIDDSKLTIETTRGPLSIKVNTDTPILNTSNVEVSDLSKGLKITVFGPKNDQQIVQARLINVSTEAASKALEKFGSSFGSGSRWSRQGQSN